MAPNLSCLGHELFSRLRGGSVFERALRRNQWFAQEFRKAVSNGLGAGAEVMFSYSYAASAVIEQAKRQRVPFILGQIDGGEYEEQYLESLGYSGKKAPAWYWTNWREEVAAADAIVVNSRWSAECLQRSGCAAKKVVVIPLAYERPTLQASGTSRLDRPASNNDRITVLFLGQLIARKGMDALLEAVAECARLGLPIDFSFVGHGEEKYIQTIGQLKNATYHGKVDPVRAAAHYASADIFILPTLSDGFAITQLEAQAWGVPVVASRNCGDVVREGENGLLLNEVSSTEIVRVLSRVVQEPALLKVLAHGSRLDERFSLNSIGNEMVALAASLGGK